jgi:hypothetical protein
MIGYYRECDCGITVALNKNFTIDTENLFKKQQSQNLTDRTLVKNSDAERKLKRTHSFSFKN